MPARTILSVALLVISASLALSCQLRVAPDCSTRRQVSIYYPHETSCSLYYRCDAGELELFTCGHGQLFDEELQTCELAENVVCDICNLFNIRHSTQCSPTPTCSTNEWGKLKPYPPDCTKYISCDMYGNGIVKSCNSGNEFSPTLNQCTTAENANCPYCTNTAATTTSTTTSTTTTTPAPTTEVVQICSEIPTCSISEAGLLKPYPPDCSKYLYCNERGVGDLSYCPRGLHFSAEHSYCMSPVLANCRNCEVTTTTEAPTIPICEPAPTCGPFDSGTMKPYPANCSAYIYCLSENNPQIRRCRPDTEFNPIANTCQSPEIASCQLCNPNVGLPETTTPEPTTPETTTPKPTTPETTTPEPTTPETTTPEPTTPETITPEPTTPETTTPKPTTPEPTTPEPTTPETTTPEPTTSETTTPKPTTPEPTTPETTTPEPTTPETTTPKPTTPEPTTPETTTPKPTTPEPTTPETTTPKPTTPEPTTPETTTPEPTTPEPTTPETTTPEPTTTLPVCLPTPICTVFEDGVIKPYPPDCSKYILCNSDTPILMVCIRGRHFSPVNNRCMEIEFAECPLCIPESFY